MSLEQLANFAEVVGLPVVIISLIYLAIQIRQSNKQAASESLKDAVNHWTDQIYKSFGTRENAELTTRALNDFSALDTAEKAQFSAALVGFVGSFDNIYNKYSDGMLSKDVFKALESAFIELAASPGANECHRALSDTFPPYIRDYFEQAQSLNRGEKTWADLWCFK